MAKRASSPTRKPAKKTSAPAKKSGKRKAGGGPKDRKPKKKAAAPAKAAKRKAGGGPKDERKPKKTKKKKAPARKAAPAARATAARAAPARTPAARAAPARTPAAKAAPARKPPAKKAGPARRAATAVKNAAKTVAAVAFAPVKAVAAAVAGPSPETDDEGPAATNGADARPVPAPDDNAFSAPDPAGLLDKIESAYGVSLPERYRRFLRDGEYERYPRIELAGYIRGPYEIDFVDELLPVVAELGQNAGIYDMDDVPWSQDYAGYVPLASLSHPDVDEPKVFLVHQVGGGQHRVLLFDYEGWRLYPLADSFESFLANLPKATNDITTAFRPGA